MAATAVALVMATAAPAVRAAEAPSGGVLVVGDSLEELTSPHLAQFLPGVPLTIDAVGGYNSFQIFDLFERSFDPAQHRVVVFDAGTNDNPSYPEILAGNLAKVAAIVDDRCLVVPTIHGLHPGGVDDSGKNQVVREFAASRPGTQTPDWQGVVFRHPELMQADNLHPTETGAKLRARLIARGVMGCFAYESGAAVSTASSRGPALEEPPAPLAHVGAMAHREAELASAIGAAVLRETAARTLAALL